ncbi:MAG: hypothetical protein H0T78_03670 [Longispora sp.]|nr:hypothetical protein [Longispora sp. (in: high G+C Gram-positive bacteria)]
MDTSTARRCLWGAVIGGLMLFVWDVAAELSLPEVNMTIPIRIHELILVAIVICVVVGSGVLSGEGRKESAMNKLEELQYDVDMVKVNVETLIRRENSDPLALNDPRYDTVRAHIDSLDDRKRLS